MGLIQFTVGYFVGVSAIWLVVYRTRIGWRACLLLLVLAGLQLAGMMQLWAGNQVVKSIANFSEFFWYGAIASIAWLAPRASGHDHSSRRLTTWLVLAALSSLSMTAVYLLTPPLSETAAERR